MFSIILWVLILTRGTRANSAHQRRMQCSFHLNRMNCSGLSLISVPPPQPHQRIVPMLTLDENRIRILRVRSFQNYDRLKTLKLSHNQISRIHPRVFDGLTDLRDLYMDNNSLTFIPLGTFRPLSNLATLDLSRNRLRFVHESLLDGLTNLNTLLLRHNQIKYVQPGSFSNLGNVRVMNLHHNRLKRMRDVFVGLSSVRVIVMSGNRIERVPLDTFSGLENLRRVYLGGNLVTSVDMTHWPEDISFVDLSRNCQLQFVANVPGNLINLSANCVEHMECTCRNENALRLVIGEYNIQQHCNGTSDLCTRPGRQRHVVAAAVEGESGPT